MHESPVASHPLPPCEATRQSVATGVSLTAAVILLTVALISLLQGVAALVGDGWYASSLRYSYELDNTRWGWTHLVLGAIATACAIGMMLGTRWGRHAAVVIAAAVIVANFLALPCSPLWSVTMIALSVVVVWAVTTWEPLR